MKIKSQKDFWSGLMFVVVGAGFAVGAQEYSFGSAARPGPGYFPFGLGILLAVLGAVVLLKSLTAATTDGDPIGRWAFKPLGIVVGSVAVFGWTLPNLGLFIALPILVLMASTAGDEFHPVEAAINAVVLTVFSWLIFIKGLSLTIPLWPSFVG